MFDKILSLFLGKTILVLVTLISSFAFSQGWNDIKTTNINLENAQYAEMFSNSFGNNVILQNTNGSITYYVVNVMLQQVWQVVRLRLKVVVLRSHKLPEMHKKYMLFTKRTAK